MKYADLPAYLIAHNIPNYLYSLDGGGTDEVVGIVPQGGEWLVYSASRGSRNTLFTSADEETAVAKFLYYMSKQAEAWGYTLPLPRDAGV